MNRKATISECGKYRWWLERQWAETGKGFVNFLMLNPSTADAEVDDPTIRKCIGFAQRWGYDGLHVTNVWAYRATDPKDLPNDCSRGDDRNWAYIEAGLLSARITVAAWGTSFRPGPAATRVLKELFAKHSETKTRCLGLTRYGDPRHPLYVPYATQLEPFEIPPLGRPRGILKGIFASCTPESAAKAMDIF